MRSLQLRLINLTLFASIAVLLLYQLDSKSLWLDEGYSLYDATHLRGFNINLRPVYYLLLNAWMSFGESIFFLRSLSVLFAISGLYLVLKLGAEIKLSITARYLAVAMIAFSPNFIRHSQEIRMCSLGILLSLVGSIVVLKLIKDPKILYWILWAFFRILVFLTVPLSASIIVSDAMIIIATFAFGDRRRELIKLPVMLLAIFIICLPFAIGQVFASAWFMEGWIKNIPKPDALIFMRMLFEDLTVSRVALFNRTPGVRLVFYGVMLGICFLPILDKNLRKQASYLMLWSFIPALILALVSHIKSSLWVERYLIFVMPYLLLLIATVLILLWKRSRIFVSIFLIVYLCFSVNGIINIRKPSGQCWITEAANFDKQVRHGDSVLSPQSERIFYSLKYYIKSPWDIYFHEKKSINTMDFLSYIWRIYENPLKEPHRPFRKVVAKSFSDELRARALITSGKLWILSSEKRDGSHSLLMLESMKTLEVIDPRSPQEKCHDHELESRSLFCKIAVWDRALVAD